MGLEAFPPFQSEERMQLPQSVEVKEAAKPKGASEGCEGPVFVSLK